MQCGDIALERAVGFYGDKAALGAETLTLMFDDIEVLGIYFGHDHGHIGSPAVSAVVGDDWALALGVSLFESGDLIFFHIDGGENEIDFRSYLLDIVLSALDDDLFRGLRHGHVKCPAIPDGLFVSFTCTSGACGYHLEFKPGVLADE